MRVETVRGAMVMDGLGTTLMHEHVFMLTPDVMQNYGHEWRWDEQDRGRGCGEATAGAQGRRRRQHRRPDRGGLGRYIPRVHEQVDINIIVATGIDTYHEAPIQFHFTGPGRVPDGPEPMVELFVKDIREGIADTGVKAGLLKGAIDEHSLTPDVERILRASGRSTSRPGRR